MAQKFLEIHPNLINEWDFERNKDIDPNSLSFGSGKKVYWVCSKMHSWQAEIRTRVKGVGCPFCKGKIATSEINLSIPRSC
jgi:hypothetical protein